MYPKVDWEYDWEYEDEDPERPEHQLHPHARARALQAPNQHLEQERFIPTITKIFFYLVFVHDIILILK